MQTRRIQALTTIELLMAIALIGMLMVAVVGSNESMFHGIGDEPLDETLRKAVREARFQAVYNGSRTLLTWDETDRSFVIRNAFGKELERMKSDAKSDKDTVIFECIMPVQGTELKDGDPDTEEVPELIFDADRCSTPFIGEIHYAGDDYAVRYDAFSNLKMEAPEKK